MASKFERFKNWLRRSGIKMVHRARRENERGEVIASSEETIEIIDSLNPFDAIVENPAYPMARIYRESAWTGILDTYDVLVGNHFTNKEHDGRKGVLDLLGFPIAARHLLYLAMDPSKGLEVIIPAGILGGLFELVRQIVAIALTITLIPAVLLAHLVLAIPAMSLRKEAGKLEVKVASETKILSTLLDDHKVAFSNVRAEEFALQNIEGMGEQERQFFSSQMASDQSYQFKSKSKASKAKVQFNTKQAMLPPLVPAQPIIDPTKPKPVVEQAQPVPPEQEKAMEAFRALNIGGRRV